MPTSSTEDHRAAISEGPLLRRFTERKDLHARILRSRHFESRCRQFGNVTDDLLQEVWLKIRVKETNFHFDNNHKYQELLDEIHSSTGATPKFDRWVLFRPRDVFNDWKKLADAKKRPKVQANAGIDSDGRTREFVDHHSDAPSRSASSVAHHILPKLCQALLHSEEDIVLARLLVQWDYIATDRADWQVLMDWYSEFLEFRGDNFTLARLDLKRKLKNDAVQKLHWAQEQDYAAHIRLPETFESKIDGEVERVCEKVVRGDVHKLRKDKPKLLQKLRKHDTVQDFMVEIEGMADVPTD